MTARTRLFAFAAAGSALVLSACGASDTVEAENESPEEVAAKVAKADIRPMPGRWETNLTIENIEVPGMPAQMQEMVKAQMGKAESSTSCLTQEKIDANDGEIFKPGDNSGCTYKNFKMGGGNLDAEMACKQGPMQQTMKMNGTYSDEAYAMKIDAEGEMQGTPMSMRMAISAKRVGDCDGTEQN